MQDIYELSSEYNTLKATLSEMVEDGHIDEDCLNNTLSDIKGDFEERCINIAKMIKNKEAYIAGLEQRHNEIKDRLKALKSKIDKAKSYNGYLTSILKNSMSHSGIDKIDTPDFLIREKRKRAGVILKVDVSELPSQYITVREEQKADLNLLYEHIKQGLDLRKYAELGDDTRLDIK